MCAWSDDRAAGEHRHESGGPLCAVHRERRHAGSDRGVSRGGGAGDDGDHAFRHAQPRGGVARADDDAAEADGAERRAAALRGESEHLPADERGLSVALRRRR